MTTSITRRRSDCLLVSVLGAVAALALGCGADRKSGPTKSASTPSAAVSPRSTAPPGQDNLTGTWSGHESGAYNGALTIVWQESGWKHTGPGTYDARLVGTIHLLAPGGTESLHGTWHGACPNAPCDHGDRISFRAVGGVPFLYTGTYSSGNMSGSYQTAKGGGSWNATQAGG